MRVGAPHSRGPQTFTPALMWMIDRMRVVGYTSTTLFTRSLGALHGVLALVVIASVDQCPLQSTRPHRVDCVWLLAELVPD